MVSLPSAICRTGTLEALYCTICGGVCPGGMRRMMVCEVAVISAIACSIRTLGLEIDADDVLAVDRGRLDPAHVAHRGADLLLGEDRHLLLVGVGGDAHVLPDQRDDRLGDLGKDVLRDRLDAGRPDDRDDAAEQDGERRDHHRIGPQQREPDQPHRCSPLARGFGALSFVTIMLQNDDKRRTGIAPRANDPAGGVTMTGTEHRGRSWPVRSRRRLAQRMALAACSRWRSARS